MTGVFRKNFTDVIKRHEKVQQHLVSSHVSIRGASLGISFLIDKVVISVILFPFLYFLFSYRQEFFFLRACGS